MWRDRVVGCIAKSAARPFGGPQGAAQVGGDFDRILSALAIAVAAAVPALAQGVDAMTCADYANQNDTEKMQTVAAVQAFTSQQQGAEQLMANEIFRELTTKCQGHDDMKLIDAMK